MEQQKTKPFVLQAKYQPSGQQPHAIEQLVEGLTSGLSKQTLLGVTGSGKTFTMANVIQQVQRPTLIMAPNKTLAAQLYGEMCAYFPNNAVEYFVSYYDYYQPEAYIPATDAFIEKDAAINEHIEQMRLSATKALLERTDTVIVATVSAIYGLGDPGDYLKMVLHLSQGEQIDQRQILRQLTAIQYQRNDIQFDRGTYRVKGSVIDIYPAESSGEAIRVDLFDDEIESIRFFDPLTNQILFRVPRVTIFPKTHYVTPREHILKAIETIKVELKERIKTLEDKHCLVEAQRIESRTRFDLEMMQEIGYCSGIENYSRHLTGRSEGMPPPTLFSYLPSDALLIIDESHVSLPQLWAMYKGDRSRKSTLVDYGFRLPSALDNRPLMFDEFESMSPQTIYVSATPGAYEQTHSDAVVELVVRPTGLLDPSVEVRPVMTQVDDLLSEVRIRAEKNQRVLATTLTKKMSEHLASYLSEQGVKVRYLHSDIGTVERSEILRDLRLGTFDVLVGINLLREGLDLPEVSLVAVLDADKEGFLRSERSLIQTMGRAARHLEGKAILYADRITKSMQVAMDETHRRRQIQMVFNERHGITPKGIKKVIHDVMEGAHVRDQLASRRGRIDDDMADRLKAYESMSPDQLSQTRKDLEEKMQAHAEALEFESAIQLRGEIEAISRITLASG